MSRVTPPVTKLFQAVRHISSSAQSSHSAVLVDSGSRYLPHTLRALKAECSSRQLKTSGSKFELVDRLTAHDLVRQQSTLMGSHRPNPSSQTPIYRIRPCMQGFKSSAPKAAAHDTSTIDFFFFPEVPEPPPANPFGGIRVPLLPDNYNPDRSRYAVESEDEAVPKPEILVVASHPEHVLPAAMSEVVGNEGLEASTEDLVGIFGKGDEAKGEKEEGVLGMMWRGLVDDVLGPKATKPSH